jgi:hypothetical protein
MRANIQKLREAVEAVHSPLFDLTFDEKRGHWGTEVEAALASAEDSLSNAIDQLEFVRFKREGRKLTK